MRDQPSWGRIDKDASMTPYQAIERLCIEADPKHNVEHLYIESQQFAHAADSVDREIESFKKNIHTLSLISVILLWSQYMAKDRVLGQRNLSMMNELLLSGALPLSASKSLLSLQNFALISHETIIDFIRCHPQWPVQKKEDHVAFYIDFANWLSQTTYGYIQIAVDPDRTFTARRQLPYNEFIKLIAYLPLRERILAKLFYLGGERTLEEVISLLIEAIDFQTGRIHFEKHFVRYPAHVLADIKELIGTKKKGFVFANKNGERLNHTVPYRALKNAIPQLKLPSSFTFKDLVRDF